MLFRGYIDESYNAKDQKLFVLSCLIATGKSWLEMERTWKLHLRAKNKQLKKAGRPEISRYHATDCSSMHGEYEGWDVTEQIEFVKGLLGTFQRTRGVHAVGYAIDLDDVCDVFPEWAADRIQTAYYLLTKFVMYTTGDDFHKLGNGAPAKITLFHDRTSNGKYDPIILEPFNQQVTDANFEYSDYFTTIAPLTWQDCIALQPADLVAFEVYKEAKGRLEARNRRRSFTALLELSEFGIHTKQFTRKILQLMREDMEKRAPVVGLDVKLRK